jgi:hypothetical protein
MKIPLERFDLVGVCSRRDNRKNGRSPVSGAGRQVGIESALVEQERGSSLGGREDAEEDSAP